MRQASPRAIPRFVPSFFTTARDLSRAQIHLPCRRERLPLLHPPSLRDASPSPFPPTRHTTRRRRDDCTSLPVKFSSTGVPIETNRFAKCRWHDWNGSQSVVVNIGRPFSIYFRCYGALPTLISEPIREAEIDGHAVNFLYECVERNYSNIKKKVLGHACAESLVLHFDFRF